MKRSLVVGILFLLSFGGVFADDDICVKPEWILEENNNKEAIYEFLTIAMRDWPWWYYYKAWFINWKITNEEAIKYYINCFTSNKEQIKELEDLLFLSYFWSILTTYDYDAFYRAWSDFNTLVDIWEKAINDLDNYGKNNINYDYYLGRYSFFLGIWYYNNWEYKKALEYLTIGFDKQNIEFKYPKNFFVTNETRNSRENTIDVLILNNYIHSYFFDKSLLNKYKDFGRGWYKYNNKLMNDSSLEL